MLCYLATRELQTRLTCRCFNDVSPHISHSKFCACGPLSCKPSLPYRDFGRPAPKLSPASQLAACRAALLGAGVGSGSGSEIPVPLAELALVTAEAGLATADADGLSAALIRVVGVVNEQVPTDGPAGACSAFSVSVFNPMPTEPAEPVTRHSQAGQGGACSAGSGAGSGAGSDAETICLCSCGWMRRVPSAICAMNPHNGDFV